MEEDSTPKSLAEDFKNCWKTMKVPGFLEKLIAKVRDQKEEEDNEEEKVVRQLLEVFSEGFFSIFPSLFNALIELKEQSLEFAVILQTFGKDMPLITKELNFFFAGEHPLYNGRNGTTRFRLEAKQGESVQFEPGLSGRFLRQSTEKDGVVFAFGGVVQEDTIQDLEARLVPEEETSCSLFRHKESETLYRVHRDFQSIYAELAEARKRSRAAALRHDHRFWRDSRSMLHAKLFLVDSSDRSVLQLFFDDLANEDERSVVDTWDICSGQRICPKAQYANTVFKADTARAMIDLRYFAKLIEVAVQARKDRDANPIPDPESVHSSSEIQNLDSQGSIIDLEKPMFGLSNPPSVSNLSDEPTRI